MAGLAATLSTLVQLMVSPVLGLADNGDYKRILRPLGLTPVLPPGHGPRFQYVWLHYKPAPAVGYPYHATEFEIIHVVRRVSTAVGFGPVFDLRLVGLVHAVLLGLATWLIVRALPGALWIRAITSLLLVVSVTDTRFIVYLNSFFTEPASLLATMFLIAAVLHAWRRPRIGAAGLAVMTIASAALIASKSQNAFLVAPILVVLISRRVAWDRVQLTGRWRGRLPGAVCALLLVVLSVVYLHDQPAGLARNNRYDAVFVELLGHSHNPGKDLVDLGLSPALAKYAGLPIYSPRNATRDPHFAGFFTTVTDLKLARYYLEHPGRALALAHRGATASMYLRPTGVSPPLGNQTLQSGAPAYYSACKLCLYSTISQGWRSASGVLLPGLWLAAVAAAWALLRGRARDTANGGLAVTLLLLVAFAVISMAVALLGEGAFEIVKHLYLTSACDAMTAVFTLHAVGLLISQRSRRRPTVAPRAPHPSVA